MGIKYAEPVDKVKGGYMDVAEGEPKYLPCTTTDRVWDRATSTSVEKSRPYKNLKDFMAHIDDAIYKT